MLTVKFKRGALEQSVRNTETEPFTLLRLKRSLLTARSASILASSMHGWSAGHSSPLSTDRPPLQFSCQRRLARSKTCSKTAPAEYTPSDGRRFRGCHRTFRPRRGATCEMRARVTTWGARVKKFARAPMLKTSLAALIQLLHVV